jgi:hypothetical protein
VKEVIFNTENLVTLDKKSISSLKKQIVDNNCEKIRFCLHKNIEDKLHEMVIVHSKGQYIRPHKHSVKTETFHIIEGKILLLIFDDKGNVLNKVMLEDYNSGGKFIFRMEKDIWHTVVPITEKVVFHEITNGPFNGIDDSIFPEWAPKLNELDMINVFVKSLDIT